MTNDPKKAARKSAKKAARKTTGRRAPAKTTRHGARDGAPGGRDGGQDGPRARDGARDNRRKSGRAGGARPAGAQGGRRSESEGEHMSRQRELVFPGDHLGSSKALQAGTGTAVVGDAVVALAPGLVNRYNDRVTVMPVNGAYEPRSGDTVVGVVAEANPGNWIIDIKAPWLAPLHVSEAPWRVDFGETMEYLRPGDAVLCKILFVDGQKKVQVTLKDRNLTKLEGGELMEVPPVKVARIIGKSGSMLNMIKEYVECWLFVGQNGRIWINGEPEEVLLAKNVINLISNEAHLPGLTDRVRAFLEANKPHKADAELTFEEEE